ncbi:MAG: HAD family hydrolase [Chloroflexi bacterium]|nr:HAD family hydrolase [Chloroflexota bacterium]
MELINSNFPRGRIRVAIFDFDGTLSLLREGWSEIMHSLVFAELEQTPQHEDEATLRDFVWDIIYQTAGQQTIYQMIRFAQEIEKRGGTPRTPEEYLRIFTEKLLERVHERVALLKSGVSAPSDWLVPGSVETLQALRAHGVTCYIASGTGESFVRDEAKLLGIAPFFAGMYGSHADYKNHSKKVIIGNIVEKHGLREGELVMFGDGATEIADAKAVGGIGAGLATNETTRDGINPIKRMALVQAGADIIIPDFCDCAELMNYLFNKN